MSKLRNVFSLQFKCSDGSYNLPKLHMNFFNKWTHFRETCNPWQSLWCSGVEKFLVSVRKIRRKWPYQSHHGSGIIGEIYFNSLRYGGALIVIQLPSSRDNARRIQIRNAGRAFVDPRSIAGPRKNISLTRHSIQRMWTMTTF